MTTTANNDTIETAADRAAELNDKLTSAGRKISLATLDSYEKTALGVADFQVKVAETSRVAWLQQVATTQADLTRDLTKAYVSAARELVK
jgi:hypothetical protein